MDRREDLGVALSTRNRTGWLWLAFALVTLPLLARAGWDLVARPQDAPGFQLESTGYEGGVLGEPVQFSLEDYRGRTVVLDLMAVACLPCREVTEEVLRPLWEEHGADPSFVLLSIDTWSDPAVGGTGGETRADLLRLQQDTGAVWRHALDTDSVWRKYDAISLPKLVVIDADGRIVHTDRGRIDAGALRAAVDASLAGEHQVERSVSLGWAGLAAAAGLASFFTPCSVGLLPAYLGLLVQPGGRLRWAAAGLAVAAGMVAVYAGIALVFWLAGPVLRPLLPWLGPAAGAALVAAGAWGLAGRSLWRGRGGGPPSVVLAAPDTPHLLAFGATFALAGFACTGPVFLPLLFSGFLESTLLGLLLLAVFAGTLALLVVGLSLAVRAGGQGLAARLGRHSAAVQRVGSALVAAAGAYLLWYYARGRA